MTAPAFPADVLARAARIRLIGFDVDGTLTDGGLYYAADGSESKRFHVQDGMGLVLLRQAGIATAWISARRSQATLLRGRELGIAHLHLGESDKLGCLRRIASAQGLGLDEVAFMGDDLPDLAVLRAVGLALAPANVHPWLLPVVHWVAPRGGGHGAVRDACDLLLQAQGRVEALLGSQAL
ncbi:KdsC family phosphatase [Thermomonas hydrothermalis]|uniref:3-deoxy-D-manno-octulosonate 8-phosphate phosphatase KdsC n=1 Tax=Thermomonas hydrothermalis TaxID=213588 RepID=A0A1M4X252_9GAMM|nr:phenylphosphate carboxylase subunit delta [Thermomonas hydrothermalis]MCL6619872.1 phenylphosphate carboxylase subunit delta [Thermomonas hydrothermalis]SHE87564.1 3-deoxy-D-manno-octulosonate 8-phosphate phosphatase (KDO 8-P phosphatase) [Thermomonas hydrothermalis]